MNGVVDRPMSTHGLKSSQGGSGPSRQIRDDKYFRVLINTKISLVFNELNKYNEKLAALDHEDNSYTVYAKRFEDMQNEIRELEGTLADYNLARDKHRGDTRPEDIMAQLKKLKKENEERSEDLDAIYLRNKEKKQELESLEREVEQLKDSVRHQISEMHPDRREEFLRLQHEGEELDHRYSEQRMEYGNVQVAFSEVQSRLHRDPVNQTKLQAFKVKEELKRAQDVRDDLLNRLQAPPLSETEQQQFLNRQLAETQRQIDDVSQRNEKLGVEYINLTRRVDEIQQELDAEIDPEVNAKHTKLHNFHKGLKDFIEKTPGEIEVTRATIQAKQMKIRSLLDEGSKLVRRQESMPSTERANETKEELDFKARQLENSKRTEIGVAAELEKRRAELGRLQSIESEIPQRISALESKFNLLKEEQSQIQSPDVVEKLGKEFKENLEARQNSLEERGLYIRTIATASSILRDTVNDKLTEIIEREKTNAAVPENDTERRVKQFLQTTQALKTSTAVELKKTDCTALQKDVKELMEQLNSGLVKQLYSAN